MVNSEQEEVLKRKDAQLDFIRECKEELEEKNLKIKTLEKELAVILKESENLKINNDHLTKELQDERRENVELKKDLQKQEKMNKVGRRDVVYAKAYLENALRHL